MDDDLNTALKEGMYRCSSFLKAVLGRSHRMKNAALPMSGKNSLKKNESGGSPTIMKRRRARGISQNVNHTSTDDGLPPPSVTTATATTIDSGTISSPTTTSSVVRDNPCWGSPTECSLSHLLTILHKSATILHEDASYVAINKIPDLRMDGDYEATVLKLLAYWYPPPSLLPLPLNNVSSTIIDNGKIEGEDGGDDKVQNKKFLLQRVASIKQHGDVDGLLRPCHQLDYATSGVLLCARSRAAANQVRLLLQDRLVSKTYLALVHGHLKVTKDWPPMLNVTSSSASSPLDEVRRRMQIQEDAYRRSRVKKGQNKSHTFVGYRPASSLFQQWQHSLQKKQQAETGEHHHHQPRPKKSKWSDKKKNNNNNNNKTQLSDDEWTLVWNELQCLNDDNDNNDDDMTELMKTVASLNWKQVREKQQAFRFERAAKKYNEILSNRQKQQQQEQQQQEEQEGIEDNTTLPVVFCMPGDDSPDTFYIYAPLAQHADDFDMRLHANVDYLVPEHLKVGNNESGDSSLDFKPCLTKCTVKSHCHVTLPLNNHNDDTDDMASNNNIKSEKEGYCYPVTKVEFSLMTGRRHQLRVHSALIGHSIVGDETYQDNVVPKDLSDRMCLHSHSLEVPLVLENSSIPKSSRSSSSSNDKNDDCADKNILRVRAPDPFVETEDGYVQINML